MGILAKIGQWVATNIPRVVTVAKKVVSFVHKTAAVVDTLIEGRKLIAENVTSEIKQSNKRTKNEDRPDLLSDKKKTSHEIVALNKSIDANKKELRTISHMNEIQHRKISLQIDLMELIVSSQTFERFTNNISLHAANLQIHLQTIQNTIGLLDDVNRQRVGIKTLMRTVNHLVNVLGVGDKVDKIENIDVDIHPGSISILRTYESFENTRDLLLKEIDAFAAAVDGQLKRVENVRAAARLLPAKSAEVSSWIEKQVEPKLLEAKNQAVSLRGELTVIPRLEANLRRELEHAKADVL